MRNKINSRCVKSNSIYINIRSSFMAQTQTKSPVKKLLHLLRLEKREIVYIYFYATLSGIIYLSLPLGIQAIVNNLFGGLLSTSIIVLIMAVVIGVFLNGVLDIVQVKISERIQQRVFTRFSMEFAYKLPRIDIADVNDYYLPELVNRFFDTTTVQKAFSKLLLILPAAIIQVLFGLILLSFYHPFFIFFGVLIILLIGLILRFTGSSGLSTSLEESQHKYEVAYWLEEIARIVKPIKYSGKTDFPMKRTDELVCRYLDSRQRHFNVLLVQSWAFVIFKVIITAALLILGSVLVMQQQLSIGQFIASEIVIIVVLNSVEKIILNLDEVYDLLTALEKVTNIFDKPNETSGSIEVAGQRANGFAIDIRDLKFKYPESNRYVLDGLNLDIQPGERICLIGTQGSGKSTLLHFLTGVYPIFEGSVLIDKIPLKNYNFRSLRNHYGIFLQSDDIFAGTLWENLTLGNPQLTPADVLSRSEKLGLQPFIQSFPEGFDTQLFSFGKKLPRHIIQKLLLCRAILGNPKLVLIEDCWHNLERKEQENIIDFLTDKENTFTLIAVTNDLQFAQKCDRVFLMDEGRIIAQGPYADVAETEIFRSSFAKWSL